MIKPEQWKNIAKTALMIKRGIGGLGAAPQKEEKDFYKECLKQVLRNVKNPKIVVLGATPELRDLGLKLGAEVISIDFNWQIIKNMTELCQIKNRSKEIIIKADWFKTPLKNNIADAVIGDAAFNNVFYKNYSRLFKIIRSWLKPGGYLIIREVFLPESDEFKSFKEVHRDYQNKRISIAGFYLRMRFMNFIASAYNPKNRELSGEKVFTSLDKEFEKGEVKKKIYDILNSRRNNVVHTILPKKEYFRILNQFFKLIKTQSGVTDKGGFYPMRMICAKSK